MLVSDYPLIVVLSGCGLVLAAVVTSCTSRKTRQPEPSLLGRHLSATDLQERAREWVESVSRSEGVLTARQLYCGRAFREAEAAAKAVGGDLIVVSAGLGLVADGDRVPSYSLTGARHHPDSICANGMRWTSSSLSIWWSELTKRLGQQKPLTRLVSNSPRTQFFLGLSSTYLSLVGTELAEMPAASRERVRVVGMSCSGIVDPRLQDRCLIEYDDRLDGPDSTIPGTKSDFAQRALRHFVNLWVRAGRPEAIEGQRDLVRAAIAGWRKPDRARRERHSDEELAAIIGDIWEECKGQVGLGLQLLRRDKGIACEQRRFKELFWAVAREKNGQEHQKA